MISMKLPDLSILNNKYNQKEFHHEATELFWFQKFINQLIILYYLQIWWGHCCLLPFNLVVLKWTTVWSNGINKFWVVFFIYFFTDEA